MLSIGPIVNDISISFNDYWNSPWATAIDDINKTVVVKKQLTHIRKNLRDRWHKARNTDYFQALKQAEFTQAVISNEVPFVWAKATLFYDRPDKLVTQRPQQTIHFGPRIMPYFEQATKELLFASPYFVPGSFGAHWFAKKRKQGVKIKILTNSLAATDVAAVHAGYKKYRKLLLKDKIELFELKPSARSFLSKFKKISADRVHASLHAKYMVLDQRYIFVGSANLDPRSGNLNTEIGIMVESTELAEQTSRLFERSTTLENSYKLSLKDDSGSLLWNTIENGRKKTYDSEPKTRFWRKLYVFLISLLPIENLL
jgi:putative cardiolipin synthase